MNFECSHGWDKRVGRNSLGKSGRPVRVRQHATSNTPHAIPLRALLTAVLLCTHTFLPGATFTVTKTTDSGSGTLRQAIINANTNVDVDTITFNLSGGTGVK